MILLGHSKNKVDDNGGQQEDTQHGGAESVIVGARATLPDGSSSPVVGDESVTHGGHGNQGEHACGDSTDLVTEVKKTNGQTAKDDGEVEPRQEGSLVSEEDLGLDSGGQSDSLTGSRLEQRC